MQEAAEAVARGAPAPSWIVVVGASAGGLEALERFFGPITAPTEAAFVVIQHLAPDHRSMMVELLANKTALPVHEAEAGQALEVDCIHLIPPGVLMTLVGNRLDLQPRPAQGLSLPIDAFLRSLATERGEGAMAVILSGSGSDGAAGAALLRAAGGYVLAQSPDSARFDSMPRSVMSATTVDAVLPPDQLAARVLALTRGEMLRGAGLGLGAGGEPDLMPVRPALERLLDTLHQRSGIDFSCYKLPTVMRRIERRMAALDCVSVSDYADRVAESVDEAELLRRELLIPVTGFFRDAVAFAALGNVLRQLLATRNSPHPLRIWCAGCATGEEAYSLAMLAMEACHAAQRWPGVKVFATDVDANVLQIAGAGSYPLGAADAIAPARLDQFFTRDERQIAVRPELRQMLLFARHNLLEDAPFTRMDLVVCRNTLIYFRAEAQERVLRRLQYSLLPGGLLFLGGSESLGALQSDFAVLDAPNRLYRLARPVLTSLAVRDGFGRPAASARGRAGAAAEHPPAPAVELAQRALLQSYVPVSLLVTARRQLLHAWGPTERLLRLPAGEASLDALNLLPEKLVAPVAHAIRSVLRDGGQHGLPLITLDLDGRRRGLRVVAREVPPVDGAEPCVLVSFEECGGTPDFGAAELPATDTAELHARIGALERELVESQHTLQASVEDLEAANEELQATNEELMSSNEELQSTNEELQSVNEELYTVNAEYNAKLDLVSALHADLEGMSRATGIATLFVDRALQLVRFTPEATQLFRLRADDVGRAIGDFACLLDYPGLIDDLRAALAGEGLRERELTGPGNQRWLARVVGYGDRNEPQRRAVLSLIDVSRLRDAERLQALIDSLPEHLALIDENGTIRQVNRAWAEFARTSSADASLAATGVGVNYLGVIARSTTPDAAELLRAIQQVLAGQRDALSVTYPCHEPGRERWYVMHVAPLRGMVSAAGGAVIAHLDVSRWAAPDAMSGTTIVPLAGVGPVPAAAAPAAPEPAPRPSGLAASRGGAA